MNIQATTMNENEQENIRWQPIILMLNRRLDCKCGAMAVFVSGHVVDGHYNQLDDVDVWCQPCFEKERAGDESES